jgi:hypothetical protein
VKIHFDRPQPTTLACTTISEHHAGALWVSAEDVAAKLTAADCMRADRGGHATEPLEWFRPKARVAAGERGCRLDTAEYTALGAAVVELCPPSAAR